MNTDFLRYSCQMILPGFKEGGQLKLKNAKVLIVGAGGLGCPAAQYLTSAGVGKIGIVDFDIISISNLHRQILYTPQDIGLKKAIVACNKLQEQNPDVELIPYCNKLDDKNVIEIMNNYDIIVDGTDNFDTKYLLNDACVLLGKPLVYGAIYQYEGQVAVWNIKQPDGKMTVNYRDLFPEVHAEQIPNCTEGGVIPSLAGIIGCMQANEVLKWITQAGELLCGKLMIFNALTMSSNIITLAKSSEEVVKGLVPSFQIPEITPIQLKEYLHQQKVELIDIRSIEERNRYDIGGKHIPLELLIQNFKNLKFRKTVVLYCASGKRSGECVKIILKQHPGFPVFSLSGGLKGWKEAFY